MECKINGVVILCKDYHSNIMCSNEVTIFTNLNKMNVKFRNGFSEEDIYKVANSRLGWYKRCSMDVVNFILSPNVLNIKTKERPDLVNPLEYYLNSL